MCFLLWFSWVVRKNMFWFRGWTVPLNKHSLSYCWCVSSSNILDKPPRGRQYDLHRATEAPDQRSTSVSEVSPNRTASSVESGHIVVQSFCKIRKNKTQLLCFIFNLFLLSCMYVAKEKLSAFHWFTKISWPLQLNSELSMLLHLPGFISHTIGTPQKITFHHPCQGGSLVYNMFWGFPLSVFIIAVASQNWTLMALNVMNYLAIFMAK